MKMFYKGVFIKKMQFLIIITCLVSQVSANSIRKDIVKLFREDQYLDRGVIKNLVFELAEGQDEYIGESTEKYLLKDNEENLWLFKTYADPIHVKNDIVVYRLAQLFGLKLPAICEIELPINGEIMYGSIQKIILDIVPLNNDLLPGQIEDIQRHHILDWLVSNYDAGKDEFFIQKKTGKIIAIDKDDAFSKEKCFSPGEDPWGDLYYKKFWENYTRGKIRVDFTRSFELINHIQNIDNNLLEDILKNSFGEILLPYWVNRRIDSIISKKENLKVDFEKFYRKLAKKKGEKFYNSFKRKTNNYSDTVLKNLRKTVYQKSLYFKRLGEKTRSKQKNIEVISSMKAWYMVDELGYPRFGQFLFLSDKILQNLRNLRENVLTVNEKLAISLYIVQINQMRKEKNWQAVGKEFPKRITMNSRRMEISQVECSLRVYSGSDRKPVSEYKDKAEKHPHNLLAHLNYIQVPMDDPDKKKLLEVYKRKLKQEPGNLIYQLVYAILADDTKYLKKMDNKFAWKYLVLGCLRDDEEEYKKVFALKGNDKVAVYWAHILLGGFFQHNSKKIRFGKGFNIEKVITSYNKALEIVPDSPEAHLHLGSLYLIKKLPEKALKEFKKIEKLLPQYAKQHFHLDKIKEKDLYGSKKEYLEAIRMNTLSGEHHYVLGLAYAVKGQNGLAKKHFNQAIKFGYKVDINFNET